MSDVAKKEARPDLSETRIDMTVTFPAVTVAQAAALRALFEQMRVLGSIGSSRWVCFYSDGDGNFRPRPTYVFSAHADVVNEWSEGAGAYEGNEYRVDFDAIASDG